MERWKLVYVIFGIVVCMAAAFVVNLAYELLEPSLGSGVGAAVAKGIRGFVSYGVLTLALMIAFGRGMAWWHAGGHVRLIGILCVTSSALIFSLGDAAGRGLAGSALSVLAAIPGMLGVGLAWVSSTDAAFRQRWGRTC